MGMFDTVIIDRLYCYYCGSAMVKYDWQTKSGDNFMDKYTLDEFFTKFYQVYQARFTGECQNCGKYVYVLLSNESEKCKEYQEDEAEKMRTKFTEEATSEHPNHKAGGFSAKGAFFQNAWCSICESKGYESGRANPDMDEEYVKEANEAAKAKSETLLTSLASWSDIVPETNDEDPAYD